MKHVKSGHIHPIVCLDAGHFGDYNRSPAVAAYYESDMNWTLHLLLKAALERYGIEVRLTRENQDTDLGVYERGAASKDCDLFLSIHSNAAGSGVDESVDYVVIYVPLNGSGDEIGQSLAEGISLVMGTPANTAARNVSTLLQGVLSISLSKTKPRLLTKSWFYPVLFVCKGGGAGFLLCAVKRQRFCHSLMILV